MPSLLSSPETAVRWVRTGAVTGIGAVVVYSTFFFVPWPLRAAVLVAMAFGALLIPASLGLRKFLILERPGILPDLAAVYNVVAAALVKAMLIVQLAVRNPPVGEAGDAAARAAREIGDRVHFGLDVSWDAFIAIGTLLFAWAALRHPRLGVGFAVPGIAIAVGLLALNVGTFPVPPAGAGSVDVGPLVGLWYLAVSIQVLRSMEWVRTVADIDGRGER